MFGNDLISDPLAESEAALKRMLQVVKPLMSIFEVPYKKITFTNNSFVGRQSSAEPVASASYGYSPDYSGSYYSPCCNYKSTLKKLLPILALLSLGLLALYLVILFTTTTAAGGRRKRHNDENNTVDTGISFCFTYNLHILSFQLHFLTKCIYRIGRHIYLV